MVTSEEIHIYYILSLYYDMFWQPLVALSKHLCGCATDLALRCLANSGLPVKGLCIACCCHHRCEWNSYVAKAFITDECGFHADDFFYLTRDVFNCT